jgi:hypothetical protein
MEYIVRYPKSAMAVSPRTCGGKTQEMSSIRMVISPQDKIKENKGTVLMTSTCYT